MVKGCPNLAKGGLVYQFERSHLERENISTSLTPSVRETIFKNNILNVILVNHLKIVICVFTWQFSIIVARQYHLNCQYS